MLRTEVRQQIVTAFREHFKAMRVHCPYPVRNPILFWVDCAELAGHEVDGEFYCKEHAEILINLL
jgi:hypothetical protein